MVFKRYVEYTTTDVALSTSTPSQLTVNASRFVSFCTNNRKSACSLYFIRELNVGTTTSHIRSNRHDARSTSLGYDISFLLVQLSI